MKIQFFLSYPERAKEALRIIIGGFRQGLRQCGLLIAKKKCSVELWKWQAMDDEDVCEDCLQRASWPAMDIADWMKEGLPRTPEAQTECEEHCRCELVRHEPNSVVKNFSPKTKQR